MMLEVTLLNLTQINDMLLKNTVYSNTYLEVIEKLKLTLGVLKKGAITKVIPNLDRFSFFML